MDHDQIVSNKIIGAAIEVHRSLGAGLLESAYQNALYVELAFRRIRFERQRAQLLEYRGQVIGEYRPDLIVENTVIVEIKSVLRFEPVFTAQVLTYLRLTGLHVGLILNVNNNVLKDGIKRVAFESTKRVSVSSVSSVVNVGAESYCFKWNGTEVVTTRGRKSSAAFSVNALWLCSR